MSVKKLLVIGGVIFFTSLSISSLPYQHASAAVTVTSSPEGQVKAHLYAYYIKECLNTSSGYWASMSGTNGASGIREGAIGPSNDSALSTGLNSTSNRACNDDMGDMMNFIGVPWASDQDKINFLCSLNGVQHEGDNPPPCTSLATGGDWHIPKDAGNSVMSSIGKIVGFDISKVNALQAYTYYYSLAFLNQCNATEIASGSAPNGDHVVVKSLQSDGSFKDIDYNYNARAVVRMNTGSPLQLGDSDQNCENIAKKANSYATDPSIKGLISKWSTQNNGSALVTSGTTTAGGAKNGTTTCAVEGVGWLVCPVMTFLSKTMDSMLQFLTVNFLIVKPELFSTTSGTFKAWDVFRSYANVAFVIVFLIIIYSQVSSVGISSYGIKRMLPRLIISAILVNISFYLCQAAVDVSNLVGLGINNLFDTIISQVVSGTPGHGEMPSWLNTIGPILVVGGVGILLALALGVLGAALIAAAMVVLILIARKAFIVILIVLAPLAFVAYLLPNTEQWFKRWWKALSTVLIVPAAVGLIFGGSKLAARVINNVGETVNTSNTDATVLQLTALGITVIPLFAVLPLLKGAMAAAGAVGAKLQGWGNKATGRAGGKAKEGWGHTSLMQGRAMRKSGEEQYRRSKFAEHVNSSGLRRQMARGIGITPRARAGKQYLDTAAESVADEDFNKDVRAASVGMSERSAGDVARSYKAGGLSEAEQAAAVEYIMSKGSFNQRKALVETSGGKSAKVRKRISDGVYSKGDDHIFGTDIGSRIMGEKDSAGNDTSIKAGADHGEADLRAQTQQNIAGGHVAAEHLVQGESATQYLVDVARGEKTTVDPTTKVRTTTAVGGGSAVAQVHLLTSSAEAKRNTGTRGKANAQAFADELGRL